MTRHDFDDDRLRRAMTGQGFRVAGAPEGPCAPAAREVSVCHCTVSVCLRRACTSLQRLEPDVHLRARPASLGGRCCHTARLWDKRAPPRLGAPPCRRCWVRRTTSPTSEATWCTTRGAPLLAHRWYSCTPMLAQLRPVSLPQGHPSRSSTFARSRRRKGQATG
jgi:hypothetical protein